MYVKSTPFQRQKVEGPKLVLLKSASGTSSPTPPGSAATDLGTSLAISPQPLKLPPCFAFRKSTPTPQNALGGWALPGHPGGAYSVPQTPQLNLRGRAQVQSTVPQGD